MTISFKFLGVRQDCRRADTSEVLELDNFTSFILYYFFSFRIVCIVLISSFEKMSWEARFISSWKFERSFLRVFLRHSFLTPNFPSCFSNDYAYTPVGSWWHVQKISKEIFNSFTQNCSFFFLHIFLKCIGNLYNVMKKYWIFFPFSLKIFEQVVSGSYKY